MASRPWSGVPAIDWGPKPSPATLYQPAREAELPKGIKGLDAALKGHRGLCVGREDELTQIVSYFEAQQEKRNAEELKATDCLGMLVTNAPGAGKTTLLEEFSMRQALAGIKCIPLSPEMLNHEEWLIKELKDYAASEKTETESYLETLEKSLAQIARESPTVPLAATATASGTLGAGLAAHEVTVPVATGVATAAGGASQFVTGLFQQLQQDRQALREALDTEQPRSAKDALITLDRVLDGKYMFVIDECQDWMDVKQGVETVKSNIRLITDPGLRRGQGREGGGTLFAGLGDATDALEGLRLTRARVIWLGELDQESAREIIESEIDQAEIPDTRRERIREAWVEQLTNDFTYWAQHAAAAGTMARKVLERSEQNPELDTASDALDQVALEWVRTLTAKQVVTLYDDRWGIAVESKSERICRAVVAAANRTDNEIRNDALYETIECASSKKIRNRCVDEVKQHAEKVITRMKRAGVIRAATDLDTDGNRRVRHWEMPVPSMRRYATENMDEAELQLAYRDADEALATTVAEYILAEEKHRRKKKKPKKDKK